MNKLAQQLSIGGICLLFAGTANAAEDDNDLMLKKIMQTMQVNVQQIDRAIKRSDWQALNKSALAIAHHPSPPLMEKIKILAYMNIDMLQFKRLDAETHDTAQLLAELAEQKQSREIVSTFKRLQTSCSTCHEAFRQDFQAYFYTQR